MIFTRWTRDIYSSKLMKHEFTEKNIHSWQLFRNMNYRLYCIDANRRSMVNWVVERAAIGGSYVKLDGPKSNPIFITSNDRSNLVKRQSRSMTVRFGWWPSIFTQPFTSVIVRFYRSRPSILDPDIEEIRVILIWLFVYSEIPIICSIAIILRNRTVLFLWNRTYIHIYRIYIILSYPGGYS